MQAQAFYIRPLVTTKIHNYSANDLFKNYGFTQNGIHYQITSPNFKFNSKVNAGLNIGIKGGYYFLETGFCTEQATSETKVVISTGQLTKELNYYNQVKVFRSPINAGLNIFEKAHTNAKTNGTYQLWFIFGVDLIYKRGGYKNFENNESFSLENNDFTIRNEYSFGVIRFVTTINLGLEYKIQNRSNTNIFSLRVNYILKHNRFDDALDNSITIKHTGSLGQIIYYVPIASSFNGIYFSISKEFDLSFKKGETK